MYKCDICGKEFENSWSIAGHKSSRHSAAHKKSVSQSKTKERIIVKKHCGKCGKEFEVVRTKNKDGYVNVPKRERKFCSFACSNSKENSGPAKSPEKLKKLEEKRFHLKQLKEGNWNYISSNFGKSKIRAKVLEEQKNKCIRCGISEWLGEELTLQLHHKDGDSKNNNRENLECLCPNCHTQTNTWGKQKHGDIGVIG